MLLQQRVFADNEWRVCRHMTVCTVALEGPNTSREQMGKCLGLATDVSRVSHLPDTD